jgi:hypothetical protein
LGTTLELGDPLRVRLLEVGLYGLHVTLESHEELLLVELRGLEAERVHDVVHSLGTVLELFTALLFGGIGTYQGSED